MRAFYTFFWGIGILGMTLIACGGGNQNGTPSAPVPSGSVNCEATLVGGIGGALVGGCLAGASTTAGMSPTPMSSTPASGNGICTDGTTAIVGAPSGVCTGMVNIDAQEEAVFTYEVGGIAKTLYIFNKDSDSGQENLTRCPYDTGPVDTIGCDDGIQNAGTNGGANADPYDGYWPPVLMSTATATDSMGDTWMSFTRVPQILSTDVDPYAQMLQLSCNGHPVYTYTADAGALGSKGNHVQSYDNRWNLLTDPCQAPLAMP